MLKRIALAAMALVVLAAATPADAQYNRYEREPREGWFAYALENTRDIPFTIMESDRRAMEDIERMYPRDSRHRRERYDYDVRHRGESLGPYVFGRRYPWDSCSYSWNSRRSCRNTDIAVAADIIGAGAGVWNAIETRKLRKEVERSNNDRAGIQAELADIDERYDTRRDERPPVHVQQSQPPAQPQTRAVTVVNMTGCKASINGEQVTINGHTTVADPSRRIYVEVASTTCNKYLDPIGDGVIALKCR